MATSSIQATVECFDIAVIKDTANIPVTTTCTDAPADISSAGKSRTDPVFAVNNFFRPFGASVLNANAYSSRTHHKQPGTPEYKSRTHARLYSATLTVVPVLVSRGMSTGYTLSDQSAASLLLIAAGIVAGPSGGSIYAEDWNLARRSILIRGTSAAFMVTGNIIRENVEDDAAGLLMIISGAIVLTGHALYDIFILSAHSVDYYNMKKRMEAGVSFNQSIPDTWSEWAAGAHPHPHTQTQPHIQLQPHTQPQSLLNLPRFTFRYHF